MSRVGIRDAYKALHAAFTAVSHINHAVSMLEWDAMAMMPPGAADARGDAKAALQTMSHERLTDVKVGHHLSAIAASSGEDVSTELSFEERANVREMRRTYDLATKLTPEFVTRQSVTVSKAEQAWRSMRKANDWASFAPHVKAVVDLAREEAEQLRAGRESELTLYETLLDKYEPGLKEHDLDNLFARLVGWIPARIKEVTASQAASPVPLPDFTTVRFPISQQAALGQRMAGDVLKFDFNQGRIDVSAHPFCGGVPTDVRLTTRYDERDFTQSLMGVVHEGGHGLYEQNRPRAWLTQPASAPRSMGIHESQSLLHEMYIGRSSPFLKLVSRMAIDSFPEAAAALEAQKPPGRPSALAPESLRRVYHAVKPGKIRVDADELCYPLHVYLRYDIERRLLSGTLDVADIPAEWDRKMRELLGVDTAGDFKDGPMQDIHWPLGLIGYFPTYTMGAAYAAQLFHAIRRDLGDATVDAAMEAGELGDIATWLRERVWSKGSMLSTADLLKSATGEGFNPAYYEAHLRTRYQP